MTYIVSGGALNSTHSLTLTSNLSFLSFPFPTLPRPNLTQVLLLSNEFWGPIFKKSYDDFMILSYDKVMITKL